MAFIVCEKSLYQHLPVIVWKNIVFFFLALTTQFNFFRAKKKKKKKKRNDKSLYLFHEKLFERRIH